ncbi:tetratricopeptide repeat protein [Fusobacterium sp. SB021]|uniref:tetratricopeptide repeat protein n=1 Tax=Fusobacterium sp. SB021 TaxID=2744227 RepID=UPI003CEE2D91
MYELEKIEELENEIEKNKNYKDMIKLGKLYERINEKYLAEKYFKMASEEEIEGLFELGIFYSIEDKLNLAEYCFKEMADKGDSNFQNALANVYRKQFDFKLAEKYYKLSVSQGNIKAVNNLGSLYYFAGKYDLVIDLLKEVKTTRAYLILGKTYYQKNDFSNSKQYLEPITKEYGEACFLLGEIYREQGQMDLAKKYYKLGANEKDDIECQKRLYVIYRDKKDSILEEKYLKLLIGNGELRFRNLLAEKYIKEKQYQKAINLLEIFEEEKLIYLKYDSFPQNDIMCNLCRCYLLIGELNRAEKYLKYIEMKDYFDYLLEVADIFYENNFKDKAEKYYLLAYGKVKYREYELSKKRKIYISHKLAEIYTEKNNLSCVEEYLKIAFDNGDTSKAPYLLGIFYIKQGNLGLAEEFFKKSDLKEAKTELEKVKEI